MGLQNSGVCVVIHLQYTGNMVSSLMSIITLRSISTRRGVGVGA